MSALASSSNAYGVMSGTSMASPYCAAGLDALRRILPDVDLEDAIRCFTSNTDLIEGDTPKMNVARAVEACRPLTAAKL
jgi:hypothetical protein